MKTPLRYQVATYDCGPISLINAFSYLYEDKEIPAIILQSICRYTLDCFDDSGNVGSGGTSRCAMRLFTEWLQSYAKIYSFPIVVSYLKGQEITEQAISNIIKENGVAVLRCYQTSEHYVLVTGVDDCSFYIFDPYYVKENFINNDQMVKFDWMHPFQYNRVVSKKRVFSTTKRDFSLGPKINRECIIQ